MPFRTFIIVTTSLATVAHIFYWDASYVLHYLKAKWKGLSSSASLGKRGTNVFVTYDTTDPWGLGVGAGTQLAGGKLEDEGETGAPLCLEERDLASSGRPLIRQPHPAASA
ncbi:hypothetical protein CRUP_002200 [Coryphaenoides rupestris]|nr:hypothetical protein CRUP_002200 [Coryphaenoides rupestris]